MPNYCQDCGKPLPIDSDSTCCWQHGGPPLKADSQIRCPFCREVILADARKCRFCGEFLLKEMLPSVPQKALSRVQPVVATPVRTEVSAPKKDGKAGAARSIGDWMGRHPIWAIVITLFVIGSLSRSLLNKDQAVTTSPPSQTESNSGPYSNIPFNLSVDKLPSNYIGNDPEKLYKQLGELEGSEKKAEFETTQAYKQRLQEQHTVPVLDKLRFDSVYAFQVEPTGLFEPTKVMYDADRELLQLAVNSGPVLNILSAPDREYLWSRAITLKESPDQMRRGAGSNAFGVTKEVIYHNSDNYEIVVHNRGAFPVFHPKGDDAYNDSFIGIEAEELEADVRALCIGKLENPYTSLGTMEKEATIDNPMSLTKDKRYIHLRLLEIWFYDLKSGKIIGKVRSKR